MMQTIVIKHKKNCEIYHVDFIEIKHFEDLFKDKKKNYPMRKIDLFWHFDSLEEMKKDLLEEVSELYSNGILTENNYSFLINNIKKYLEEKNNPNFNRVYWKRDECIRGD